MEFADATIWFDHPIVHIIKYVQMQYDFIKHYVIIYVILHIIYDVYSCVIYSISFP